MRTRKVALMIFYDKDGKILIQDRQGVAKVGEEWGGFGGEIEKGETAEEAVTREIQEELCYTVEDPKHLLHYEYLIKELDWKIEADGFIAPAPHIGSFCQKGSKTMKFFILDEARKLKMVCKEDRKPINALKKRLKQ